MRDSNIVVIIHALRNDSRPTSVSHAFFAAHFPADYTVILLNIFGPINPELLNLEIDLLIFTYDFLALRAVPFWQKLIKRIKPLLKNSKKSVAFVQDDYSYCNNADDFFIKNSIASVYTPLVEHHSTFFPKATEAGVNFKEALTGYYVKPNRTSHHKVKTFVERDFDLGQRVRLLSYRYGAQARTKSEIAIFFGKLAENAGFLVDISTKEEDTLKGDDWFNFLGNTRFVIGSKGGVGIADPSGRLERISEAANSVLGSKNVEKFDRFLAKRSKIKGDFQALSPRIFESIEFGACQILLEDNYLEILKPWIHYVPLKKSLSNVGEVLEFMRDWNAANVMTEKAKDLLDHTSSLSYADFAKSFLYNEFGKSYTDMEGSTIIDLAGNFEELNCMNNGANFWIRDYLRRVLIKNELDNALFSAQSGVLKIFDPIDKEWAVLLEGKLNLVSTWLESWQKGELIVESLVWPWRTYSRNLQTNPNNHLT